MKKGQSNLLAPLLEPENKKWYSAQIDESVQQEIIAMQTRLNQDEPEEENKGDDPLMDDLEAPESPPLKQYESTNF